MKGDFKKLLTGILSTVFLIAGAVLLGFREALKKFDPTALGIILIVLGLSIFAISLIKSMLNCLFEDK